MQRERHTQSTSACPRGGGGSGGEHGDVAGTRVVVVWWWQRGWYKELVVVVQYKCPPRPCSVIRPPGLFFPGKGGRDCDGRRASQCPAHGHVGGDAEEHTS